MEKKKYKEVEYTGDNPKYQGMMVRAYDDGSIRTNQARIIKPPDKVKEHLITSENAIAYVRKRQEKTARLLRERILEAHNSGMPISANSASDAFAMSGAMLYEQIVTNTDAYPRDRLETWDKLGKYAQVLADPKDKPEETQPQAQTIDAVAGLVAQVRGLLDDVIGKKKNPGD